MNALDLAAGRAWALSEDDLMTIMTIAARQGEGPEAVATRLGRPLQNTRDVTMHGSVAVVPLEGPMFRRANLFTELSGATSTEQFARDFQAAIDEPAVSAVIPYISSPGGEASGVNEVAKAIFAARGKKPIWAYVSDMAASGAYWIASAADRIIIDDAAMLGSIGVVTRYVRNPDRPGVRVTEVVSSQSPKKRLDPESEAGRSEIQRQVDAIAQVFVEAVARHRGIDPARVIESFGQGGVEIGRAAIDLGMADQIGSLDAVIEELSRRASVPASTPSPRRFSMMGTKPAGDQLVIEPLNTAQLAAFYPEAAEELREQGRVAARAATAQLVAEAREGATATERTRIAAIQEAAMPGQDKLRDEAISAGMSAGDFALAQSRAIKAQGPAALEALKNDEAALGALGALKPGAAPDPAKPIDPNLPLDQRIKAEWDASPQIRGEFGGAYGSYLAYRQAEEAGTVRRIGKAS